MCKWNLYKFVNYCTFPERPKVHVKLLTGWSEVFSTDTLALQCEVEGPYEWNYTWWLTEWQIRRIPQCCDALVLTDSCCTILNSCRYKNDHEINGSHSKVHYVTPQNDPEQSPYKCKGVRSERPLYSKFSGPLKTRNLRKCTLNFTSRILGRCLISESLFLTEMCSFEEAGAPRHLWLYPLRNCCHHLRMHHSQSLPQTRFLFSIRLIWRLTLGFHDFANVGNFKGYLVFKVDF